MKRYLTALTAAAIAVGTLAAPVAAWHVDTGDCRSDAKGAIHEPYGDPWGRVVVRNDLTCRGWVRVPDESWVGDGYLIVDGKRAARGERIRLRPGSYVGRWTNSDEVERFTIRDLAGPVTVGWSYRGREGKATEVVTVPAGCAWRSGYRWLRPGSRTKLWDRTSRRLLIPQRGQRTALRVSKAGWYRALDRGFVRGLDCVTVAS